MSIAQLNRGLARGLPYTDAINDYSGISRDNLDRIRAFGNRHFNADEVVLNRAVAHRVMLADVGVALRHGDILRRTVIKRHLNAELEPRP